MRIIYEDKHILAIHKPAGLATQTSRIGEKDLYSEAKNHVNGNYIGIINRLDQPVEGIVLLAKDNKTAAALEEQLQSHTMQKYYRATVYLPDKEKTANISVDITSTTTKENLETSTNSDGEVDIIPYSHLLSDYLCRDKNNTSRICSPDDPDAKEARLEYNISSIEEHEARLDIHLLTGRHHQIRVQLANAGMPILGDRKYGTNDSIKYSMLRKIRNVSLCAYRLVFTHPLTGEKMDLKVDS